MKTRLRYWTHGSIQCFSSLSAVARVCVIRQGFFQFDPRVRREVAALLHAGHEVDLICLRHGDEPIREREGRLRLIRLPFPRGRGATVGYLLQYAGFLLLAGILVTLLHLRRRYSVVQVNSLPDTLVFAAAGPKLLGARVMLDLHECMPEFFATKYGVGMDHWTTRLVARAEQASIRFANFAITCTDQMREAFVDRGADAARIGVIHNAAEEDVWDPANADGADRDGDFTLVCHGSLEPRYGLDTAIGAVALLRDEIPELRLEIFGEGSELPTLHRLAEERGVTDRVWFSDGFVPLPDLVRAVGSADAGVVAMKRDEFRDLTHCNKMYDLIAMRRPVITSWTRSVAEYFSDEALLYFESDNESDLARAIRELHDDRTRGERAVERATQELAPDRWPRQRELAQGYVGDLVERRQPVPSDG